MNVYLTRLLATPAAQGIVWVTCIFSCSHVFAFSNYDIYDFFFDFTAYVIAKWNTDLLTGCCFQLINKPQAFFFRKIQMPLISAEFQYSRSK